MSWLFAFAALGVVALVAFAHVGLRAAWAATSAGAEVEHVEPPPKPLPRFERGKRGCPSELWLEDGRVLLNESDWVAEFGMGEFFRNAWFVPDTGEFVPVALIDEAYAAIGAKERARKYGAAR